MPKRAIGWPLAGAAIATACAVLSAMPAQALVINPSYDSIITNSPYAGVVEGGIQTAINAYEQALSGTDAVVNIAFSWGTIHGQGLPDTALGTSATSLYGYFNYNQVRSALGSAAAASPTNVALNSAVANLPLAPPAGGAPYVIPSAEAKALGLVPRNGPLLDGYIGFAGSAPQFTWDPAGGVAPGTYDFQAIAAHEIAEVLGRISGVEASGASRYRTVFDLFRYAAPGALSFSSGEPAYFSVDGGLTSLAFFNNVGTGDRGDWLVMPASGDVQDAFVFGGSNLNISATDLAALDALGWNGTNVGNATNAALATAAFNLDSATVPEPSGLALVLSGALAAFLTLRRKGTAVAKPRRAKG